MPAITTSLSESRLCFLDACAKRLGKPKNYVLEMGLALLEERMLEEAIREGFEISRKEQKEISEQFWSAQINSLKP